MSVLDRYFQVMSEGAQDAQFRKQAQDVFKRVRTALGSVKPEQLKVTTNLDPTAVVNLGALLGDPELKDLDLRFVKSPGADNRGTFRPFKTGAHKIDISVGSKKPELKPSWTTTGAGEDDRPQADEGDWGEEVVKNGATLFSLAQEVFFHEFIHYLDFKRIQPDNRMGAIKGTPSMKKAGPQKYYSSPLEFNAFLQQGLSKIETYLERQPPEKVKQTIGGSADEFYRRVLKVLTPGFAKNLDAKYQAKLKKRIARAFQDITSKTQEKR